MDGSFKVCPACGLQAPISAGNCVGCGHQYRTQFVNQTQAFIPPVVHPVRRPFPVWGTVLIVLAGMCVLMGLVGSMLGPSRSYGPRKMDMAREIHQGMPASEVIAKFGQPDDVDKEPGPLPNETWIYYTVDGSVVVSVYLGTTVKDVFTL